MEWKLNAKYSERKEKEKDIQSENCYGLFCYAIKKKMYIEQ